MALVKPLFMQTGSYTAAEDRLLGASLAMPGRGDTQTGAIMFSPRVGVLPWAVALGGASERSMQPTPLGAASPGVVAVDAGSAIVGNSSGIFSSTYFVVNTAPVAVNCVPEGESPTGQQVQLWLAVRDPAVTSGIEGEGYAEFVVTPYSGEGGGGTPPESAIPLAIVTLNPGAAVTINTDLREFTTSHGGTFQVATLEQLSAEPLASAPFGSSVYVISTSDIYFRTSFGWERIGGVPSGPASSQPTSSLFTGQTYFDTDSNRLLLCTNAAAGTWQVVGQTVGQARRGAEAAYSGKRYAYGLTGEFYGNISGANGWVKASALPNAGGGLSPGRPSDSEMTLRFEVTSKATPVHAVLSTGIWVCEQDKNNTWVQEYAYAALRITKAGQSGASATVPGYEWETSTHFRYGLGFHFQFDTYKSRPIEYVLDPGEYVLQPYFSKPGGTTRTLHVHGLMIEVSL